MVKNEIAKIPPDLVRDIYEYCENLIDIVEYFPENLSELWIKNLYPFCYGLQVSTFKNL